MDELVRPEFTIRPASLEEVVELRHSVLRQGLPRSAAIFPGDGAETSLHYGAFHDGQVLCCATLHMNQWEGEPAWQLRGMATAPHARRQGLGRHVLERMEQDLRSAATRTGSPLLLWCNARVPAVQFYQGLGWLVVSEQFDIPTAGPHVRMVKRLV
jgi:GNAT superfamily N-acetyltransferase